MAKQTMGTPVQSWPYRSDNKLFRIQNPQTPIVRNFAHDEYHIDEYLTGTNAVVAVLAYTGYDMEDAMIINKSSYEARILSWNKIDTKIVNQKNKDELII